MTSKHVNTFTVSLVLSVLMAAYWLFWASDRFVSSAQLQVNRTDLQMQSTDITSLFSGANGVNRSDQLTLRAYLLSTQMLQKIDASLDLRAHYSDPKQDWVSRMWDRNTPLEWFHRHFMNRFSVELDEYSGLLTVTAEAYKPEVAQRIVQMVVSDGEVFMNANAHSLAQTQVDFLQQQVGLMSDRHMQARQALLAYQNSKRMASPQATAENILAIIAKLESQLSELNVQRHALLAYLVPSHPSVSLIEQQIAATQGQLQMQKNRMAAPNAATLNLALEEYQRLQTEAAFAEEIYKAALATLEKGKLEALRTIKKLSLVQEALLPQSPMLPRRIYNTVLSVVLIWMLAGVTYLMMAIVKDHQE